MIRLALAAISLLLPGLAHAAYSTVVGTHSFVSGVIQLSNDVLIAGTAISTGPGAANSGTQRVAVASGAVVSVTGSSVTAYQGDGWGVSQVGPYTVTPGTGSWNVSGSSVSVAFATIPNVRIIDGGGQTVKVAPGGYMRASINEPNSAFGEILTADNYPVLQNHFVYGANDEDFLFLSNGNASTGTYSGMVTVTGSTNTYAIATIKTRRNLSYRPGQGSLSRFTAMFSTGTIGVSQFAGLGNSESALGFGTDATTGLFGVFRSSGGIRQLNTVSINTKSSNSQTATVTLGGQAFSCPVTNGANIATTANDIAACDYTTLYPGWYPSIQGSSVTFIPSVPGPIAGTFSITFPTSGAGTFSQTRAGANPTVEFADQAHWNVDTYDGSGSTSNPSGNRINFNNLNVYAIDLQYLGAGQIAFKVEDPTTGLFETVHGIRYASREKTPSLTNPTLPFVYSVRNVGVASQLQMAGACVSGFNQGPPVGFGQERSYLIDTPTLATTYAPILTLRNSRLFSSSIVNQKELIPVQVNVSNTGGKGMSIQLWETATVSNDSSFVYVSTNTSPAKIDVSATSITGGTLVVSRSIPSGQALDMDLTKYLLNLEPGNSLTISARAVASPGTTASISIQWYDGF